MASSSSTGHPRTVTNPGVHHIKVKAVGVRGVNARGFKKIAVTVRG